MGVKLIVEILGDLIRTLVMIALISIILDMLVPGDDYRRYLRMVIGLIILLIVVNAISNFTKRGEIDIFAITNIPVSPAEQNLLAEEGQRLWELNQQQVLREYNRMIKDYLQNEIRQLGGWELADIELEFENNLANQGGQQTETYTYAEFGDIRMVRAFISNTKTPVVENTDSDDNIRIAVAEVPPVQIGYGVSGQVRVNGSEEEIAEQSDETHDVNQETVSIQDHIARLLQVSPEKVQVIFISEGTSMR